ncbi:MAG: hypothetical protein ACFFFG_03925 [Candidatus Thorarchaeota archaeon]
MKNKTKQYTYHNMFRIGALFVLTAIAISAIVASFSLPASISIESVIYEVNDHGDLTIQLTGTKTGVSVVDADISLQIPDTFDMETLTNGSPVIKMLSNGTTLEKAENSTSFRVVFALRTLNTTLLPRHFFFKMNFGTMRHSVEITPQWPPNQESQTAGGGAAVTSSSPYISSFYAYDSEKGQAEHVKTYIYNPTTYFAFLQYLLYTIKGNTYNSWEDDTPTYSENGWIESGMTLVVHDYLDYMFTSPGTPVKRYALNRGNYDITRVYALGSGAPGTWSDNYYPSSAHGNFDVNDPASGTHVVFVTHLVDQAFRIQFDENAWFDTTIELIDFWYNQQLTDLRTLFAMDFRSMVFTWDPPSNDIYDLIHNKMAPKAKDLLGLSGDWESSHGTSSKNHGFDLLFANINQYNTNGMVAGLNSPGHSNKAIMMKGYFIWIFPFMRDQTLGTMHETLHTFNANHITGDLTGYIMSRTSGAYVMHSQTVNEVDLSTYN